MDIQQQIKSNADDVQAFIRDMSNWEKDMKRKEHYLLRSSDIDDDKNLPPIRNKIGRIEKETSSEKLIDQANSSKTSDKQTREQSLFEKERGNELVKQKKWTEAVYRYTRAIECFPNDATFYSNRAHCFLQLKKWAEAETDCTTALQIDPKYNKAYYRRAVALIELSQFREARDDLNKALELDPNNSRITNEISRLEKLIVNREAPVEVSTVTKSEVPKDNKQLANIKKEKGNAFVKKNNWKSAIECYTEACGLYPEDASFYLNRALCFLKTAQPRKTILDCIRVLELDPNNVKAYYRRALAHLNVGNQSEAHDDLLMAFKLDPSNKAVQDSLTNLETDLGILSKKTKKEEENRSQSEKNKPDASESETTAKRISGERFIRLGGRFVKAERKSPHLLSKKPLRKVKIFDKGENTETVLKNALDELKESNSPQTENAISSRLQASINCGSETTANKDTELDPKINVDELPVPKTAMQFSSTWDQLSSNPKLQYKYLKKIDGNSLTSIFKEALESYVFSEILEILATQFVETCEPVFPYLYGLSKVKRFSALLLFANENDNANIRLLFSHCEKLQEVPKDKLDELRPHYYC